MITGRLYNYDVWGNADEGWEVNDRYFWRDISLPTEYSKKDVWRALLRVGFLKSTVKFDKLDIDISRAEGITVDRVSDGMPICEINFDE